MSHGDGIYLYDESGKRYIDGSGGPLVVNVGHGRAEIVQAMAEQAQRAAYVHALMFTSQPVEQLSAELAEVVPMPDARFFYLSSGSEVVEGAIKLARQIQQARGENQRHLIIGREQKLSRHDVGCVGRQWAARFACTVSGDAA
ncbi:MAG: aspartate aminotransferase family protein [Anaerolineae bacterium]|nr:aspartate aminotransferase family protein [Anaerolineae bacterium]